MDFLLACSKEEHLLQQTKHFYVLNLTKMSMHYHATWHCSVPVPVSLYPPALWPCCLCLSLSLPHTPGNHLPAIEPVLWSQNPPFTSLSVEPFPECSLTSKDEQNSTGFLRSHSTGISLKLQSFLLSSVWWICCGIPAFLLLQVILGASKRHSCHRSKCVSDPPPTLSPSTCIWL